MDTRDRDRDDANEDRMSLDDLTLRATVRGGERARDPWHPRTIAPRTLVLSVHPFRSHVRSQDPFP